MKFVNTLIRSRRTENRFDTLVYVHETVLVRTIQDFKSDKEKIRFIPTKRWKSIVFQSHTLFRAKI